MSSEKLSKAFYRKSDCVELQQAITETTCSLFRFKEKILTQPDSNKYPEWTGINKTGLATSAKEQRCFIEKLSKENNIKLLILFICQGTQRRTLWNLWKITNLNGWCLELGKGKPLHEKVLRLHSTFGICYNQAETKAMWVSPKLRF